MKLLYIADFLYIHSSGAHTSACAHLDTLRKLYGNERVDIIALTGKQNVVSQNNEIALVRGSKTALGLWINCAMGFPTYLNRRGQRTIIKQIEKGKYSVIFIDNSIYGNLIKKIKKSFPNIAVLAYYHDVKAVLGREWRKKAPFYRKIIYQAMIQNEKLTQKNSDVNIVLNPREEKLYYRAYGRKPEQMLSVYMDVILGENYIQTKREKESPLRLLFVGGYYRPNVEGILWFTERVLPSLIDKIELVIAGNNMEKLQEKRKFPDQVTIKGFVPDLKSLYSNADVVISPLFEGGGMKVKMAEAMGYGKIIIGSDESYQGYRENIPEEYWEKFFYRANNAQEFIESIICINLRRNNLQRYYREIREIYELYYSPDYAEKVIKKSVQLAVRKARQGG